MVVLHRKVDSQASRSDRFNVRLLQPVLFFLHLCVGAYRYSFARDVAAGLWHLHAERFVHRDLAARNLLLDMGSSDGSSSPPATRVKIADFGMSRVVREMSSSSSSDEDRRGALMWMAPEVLQHGDYSPASDMFSFGVVLSEIWTTRQPYEGLDQIEAAQRVVTHGLRPSLELPTLALATEQTHESTSAAAALTSSHASGGSDDSRNGSVVAPHTLYAQVIQRCLGAAPDSRMTAHEAHASLESLLALPRGGDT